MDDSFVKSLPWDRIMSLSKDNIDTLPEETLEFAADEANHDQMFKSALASLKNKNPDATFEEAEKLVKQMREFAKVALESRKITR